MIVTDYDAKTNITKKPTSGLVTISTSLDDAVDFDLNKRKQESL